MSETLYSNVAPLRNVSALTTLIERVQGRAYGLPGMATFYGPSGLGKTSAGIYAANRYQAHLVEVRSVWKSRKFCQAVLVELGIKPGPTVADMLDQIAEGLLRSGAPLIIDEADHLVTNRTIQLVRDIHDASGAPVILIGEELLPQKLQQWERIHGRMLDWVACQPAEAADVTALARIYCPGIQLDEALSASLLATSGGSIRRISVNLALLAEHAAVRGLRRLGPKDFDARRFFTGEAPGPRRGLAPIAAVRRAVA